MKKKLIFLMLGLALLITHFAASAAALTDYTENLAVDHLLRGQTFSESTPANYYVALYTTACSDSAAGTEVTGGSYARVAIARSTAAWVGTHGTTTGASSGTNGTVSNAAAATFPAATADWGTVTHWGIIDASTAGNPIICAAMTTSRNITTGSTPSFAVSALTVQIDN
ncbi:MAG: hypothetical protein Q8L15_06920 [Methylobacter sp.]|nr:hypothetical protein [Methylobacter sp.]